MKTLVAAFKGKTNSSKLFLDELTPDFKLYLDNDKEKSCLQLERAIKADEFGCIILLGQKPLLKDKISIELVARKGIDDCLKDEKNIRQLAIENEREIRELQTNFDYVWLQKLLFGCNIDFVLSKKAGNSYCNHIYSFALSKLENVQAYPKIIFLHLPQMKNFFSFDKMVKGFSEILNIIKNM